MAFSKAHRFAPRDYHYSLICRALGHPARLAILRTLHAKGKCEVKELLTGMPISTPAVSQHLRILREMQIISSEQVYPTVFYWLNDALPDTYHCVLALLGRSETVALQNPVEIREVGRFTRPSAGGI